MKKFNRLLLTGVKTSFVLMFVFVGIQKSTAQDAADYCNCPDGFPTRVPPQAVKNGAILASDLFRYLRLPAHPPVSRRCLIIDKPLIFNEPWRRKMLNCHLSMEAGSSIIILPTSGGLHFRGGSIRGCDNGLWNGISVSSGSELDLEASVVSGASTAISVADSVNLKLRGNLIEDNFFGMQIEAGASLTGVPIFGCTFKNCRVGVNNKGNIIVGGEPSPNIFDSCETGILSTDGNLFVSNTTFKECNTAILTNKNESVEIVGINFDKCTSGIRDINSNINIENNVFDSIKLDAVDLSGHVLRSIEIQGNKINAWDGIEATNIFSENFIISNNDFTPSGQFLSSVTLSNVKAKDGNIESNTFKSDAQIITADGILLNTCTGINIRNNTIKTHAYSSVGMEIVNSSQMSVSENKVYGGDTEVGIVIENSQIDLNCNELYNHLNGIVVKGFSKSDIATNSIYGGAVGILFDIDAISGPQIHSGNLWEGKFTSAGAFHYNFDKSFYSLSNFFANDATDKAFPTKVYPSAWFEKRSGNTRTCGTGGKMTQETLDQEFNQQLLTDNIYTNADNRALNFEATRYLFETDIASKTKTDLLTKPENRNIKPLNEVKRGFDNLIDYDALAMMNYKNQQNELKVVLEELSLLKNHSAETIFDSNEEQLNLNIKLKTLLQKIKNQRAELLSELKSRAAQLTTTLSHIDAQEVFESNEVFIQQLHLKILKDGINTISEKEKAQVKALAKGNPNVDGMAVYKAKGLLYEIHEIPDPHSIETQTPIIFEEPRNNISNELELEIFPNPTSEFLNIRTLLTSNAFEICNLTGQLIKSGNLTNNMIKIADLPEGFYILRVLGNNQVLGTEKFSVIR